ncbi:MAG: Fic family protein [Candidatus Methylomirabilales bacterium]
MPFSPRYTISDHIVRNLEVIAEVKGVIENAPLLPAFESSLQREAMVRSVHASVRLEGNRLEEEQVEKVVAGQKIKAWEKDVQEVKNYARLLDFISSVYKDPSFKILEATIREMNRTLLAGIDDVNGGNFRTIPVAVQNTRTGELVFTPPDAFQVPILVKDLVDWLEADKIISPVLEAGIAHYELVRIHPFVDGNGRCSRALAVLVLYRRGYDIRRIFSVEDYADEHPDAYYGALKESDQKGEVTPFLEFWSEALANELSKVKAKVLAASLDKRVRDRIGQTYLNQRQWEAVLYVVRNGSISASEYVDLLNGRASLRTVKADLTFLVKKGVLVREGRGPATRYRLHGDAR